MCGCFWLFLSGCAQVGSFRAGSRSLLWDHGDRGVKPDPPRQAPEATRTRSLVLGYFPNHLVRMWGALLSQSPFQSIMQKFHVPVDNTPDSDPRDGK